MQDLSGLVQGLSPQKQKALAVLLQQKGINLFGVVPIAHWARPERLSVSYAQRRQWFLWQLDPDSDAYNIPVVLRLRGPLSVSALQQAFDALARRHESLRTVFAQAGSEAVQVIEDAVSVALELQDVAAGSGELEALIEREVCRPFDLRTGPLLRVKLLRESPEAHVLVVVMHHIVSDAWSMQLMVEELVTLYAGYRRGVASELPALPIQYADYATWQRNWLDAGERDRQLGYWTKQLGGVQPVLELPLDRPRPAEQSFRGAELALRISGSLHSGLQQLAQRTGTTMFMLLVAAFQALLHRYTGQSDIRIGVPVANRNRLETERLIGFFVNTQVLKAEVSARQPFDQLLQQVKQTVLDAQSYQDLPFEQLVEALQPERSLSHNPLFQVLVNHQIERRNSGERTVADLRIEAVSSATQAAQLDLTLDLDEAPEAIFATFTYATDLFDASTIERLARHWQNMLQGIVSDAAQCVADLPLLTAEELHQQRSCQRREYALDSGYARLFERQVDLTPERVAARCMAERWSYRELDELANRVAHALRAATATEDRPIALLAERGLPLLAMMIGCFKAGAAYLALDPDLPDGRLAELLASAGTPVVLSCQTHAARAAQLAGAHTEALVWEDIQRAARVDRIESVVGAQHLAYVIYTSGSTGKPKGVLVEQAGMLNNQLSKIPYLKLSERDVIAQTASQSFDISVWQFLTAALCGACVEIVPNAIAHDPRALLRHVSERGITVLESVPALIQAMVDGPAQPLDSLRWLLPTGEALPLELARRWLARYPNIPLVNAYGPAECSDDVALQRLHEAPSVGSSVPIGSATDNNQIYVLNAELQPIPTGMVGEIFVSGIGVGRGYLNDRARTADAFFPNPFSAHGERLYRTGDLGKFRADGSIEFVGRIDQQVKIRGFRIELAEIEACLQTLEQTREAVVVAQPGPTGPQLVAYIVPRDASADVQALREQLRAALKATLPDYMVPACLMVLPQLPLTPNGKVDKKALPLPEADASRAYEAPQTDLEQQLAAIWADVLRVSRVGLNDNFFELGGHSLLVINVMSRVQLETGIAATLHVLFQSPVLREFASALAQLAQQPSDETLDALLEEMLSETEIEGDDE